MIAALSAELDQVFLFPQLQQTFHIGPSLLGLSLAYKYIP